LLLGLGGDNVRVMKKVQTSLMMTLSAFVFLFGTDLTGKWNSKVDVAGQAGMPTFVLKQEGTKLSGTYSGFYGEAPLVGTVNGNKVAWDFEASGAKIHYAGEVSADGKKIQGTVDYGGQADGTFTATKDNPAGKKRR
jgi:hypothetical protein